MHHNLLGMTVVESKVFESLVEGARSASEIAQLTCLHRPNVYDTLQRLMAKGLVTSVSRDKGKVYQLVEADVLLEQEEERKRQVEQLMLRMKANKYERSEVHSSQGVQAIQDMLNSLLKAGVPISVYGIPKEALVLLQPFIMNFHKRRITEKVQMNHIYNEDAQERIAHLNTLPYTAARYLPKKYNSPVSTNICGNVVSMIHWGGEQPVVITITKRAIADAYQRYFELLWEEAKI